MRATPTAVGALTLLATAIAWAQAPAVVGAPQARPRATARPPRQAYRRHGRAVAHAAIIGGTVARKNTFPQLAFIVHRTPVSGFTCTGTVVAPSLVLTAAHCAENTETGELEAPSGYEVITGNVEWTASPRQVSG